MIQTSQMTLEEFNQGAERWRQQCLTYINALLEQKQCERESHAWDNRDGAAQRHA